MKVKTYQDAWHIQLIEIEDPQGRDLKIAQIT
jgi:hypothetical protein